MTVTVMAGITETVVMDVAMARARGKARDKAMAKGKVMERAMAKARDTAAVCFLNSNKSRNCLIV